MTAPAERPEAGTESRDVRRLPELLSQIEGDRRRRWSSGERMPAETYLASFPELFSDEHAAVDLIYGEFLLREQAGERPSPQEYLDRFPQFAAALARQFEVHEALATTTKGAGPSAAVSILVEGRLRCPHCFERVALHGEGAPEVGSRGVGPREVACPACGSRFRVEGASPAGEARTSPEAGSIGDEEEHPRTIGRFQVLRALGVGAFGTVYLAQDPALARKVAIKVPRAGTLSGREERGRFLREARSLAQLSHRGIVPVFEVGEVGSIPYLVSEYVRGETLAEHMAAHRLGLREAAELVAAVADALQYAHEQGVIHRDVKPSNMMVTPAEVGSQGQTRMSAPPVGSDTVGQTFLCVLHPRLMDFGLAKRDAGEVTMTVDGRLLGTPAYMSPEQAAGESHKVDGRSDVYSLGVILYELLTGELPFRGNVRMLIEQVLRDEPRAPRSLNNHVPRDLETICLKAMAKEPAGRYQTAGEFAADLRRWLRGDVIVARPISRVGRTWRWCRRNPLPASLAATTVLLLAALVTGSIITAFREGSLRARAEERLIQLHVTQGNFVAEDGDLFRALPWYVEALRLEEGSTERESAHRVRIASLLRRAPRLEQMWFHDAAVNTAEFNRDGTRVVTASEDGTARVWDATTGRPVTPPLEHGGAVKHATFSPDGTCVATASYDRTARVWSASTGEPLTPPLEHDYPVNWVAFSADGTRLATASGDMVQLTPGGDARLWNVAEAELLGRMEHRNPSAGLVIVARVTFSPDGRYLATGSYAGTAGLWDGQTADEIAILGADRYAAWAEARGREFVESESLYDMGSWVNTVAFSHDSRLLLTGESNGFAIVWDTQSAEPVGRYVYHDAKYSAYVFHGEFSPDGGRFVTASYDHTARVWEVGSSRRVVELPHTFAVYTASFSPDGTRVVTASGDHSVRVRDAETGELLAAPLWHADVVNQAWFSPDGRMVLTASDDGAARLWDLEPRGDVLWTCQGAFGIKEAIVDAQAYPVAAHDRTPHFFLRPRSESSGTVQEGRGPAVVPYLEFFREVVVDGLVRSIALDDDRTLLVAAGTRVLSYDRVTAEPSGPPRDFGEEVVCMRCCGDLPAARPLAVTISGTVARVWNVQSGQVVGASLELPAGGGEGDVWAALSSTGERVVLAAGRVAQIADVASGEAVGKLLRHAGAITSVSFSADDRMVLTTGADRTVRVWDAETGEPLAPPLVHGGVVRGASSSRDGRWVASASEDRTVRVWDVATGLPITRPLGHRDDVNVALFSADGRRLFVGCDADDARIYDISPDPRPVAELRAWAALLSGGQSVAAESDSSAGDFGDLRATWEALRSRGRGQ